MLLTLRIRNLVIIEDLTVEFAPGLNLLTGETGTGKSIVVDAVGLAVGRRADRSLIRSGADKAVVEALFEVDEDSSVREWAEREMPDLLSELLEDGQLVVRREVSGTGGVIRLNGSPCTQAMLRELGSRLLELHGQHEFRSLVQPEQHLALVDRFAAHSSALERVAALYRGVVEARDRLAELRDAARDRLDRIRKLEETVDEIDAVGPRVGELAELDRERHVLRNAEAVSRLVQEVVELTYEGETTAASMASAAARSARGLAELDPSLREIAERLETAGLEIQEAGAAVRDYRDRSDFNPQRLEVLEARRVALERLLLRYGADEAEVLSRREEARAELDRLGDYDQTLERMAAELARLEQDYADAAQDLGRSRSTAAAELAPAVERQLRDLAFGKSSFDVRFTPAPGPTVVSAEGREVPLAPRGAERAEFMLAANPGEPSRPLNRVASGGELSRVMLGLHAVVDGAGEDRVLVFDEVDAGVGGRVADAVGARLARLARRNQVLCVTHLPQVAAYADQHFAVRKWVKGGRTTTDVTPLGRAQRVEEIARMLGGRAATPASRRHASELLGAAGRAAGRSGAVARRKA